MAARRLNDKERLLDIRAPEGPEEVEVEGYQVHSRRDGEVPERRVLTDAPPDAFTARLTGDHGEVRVSPMVDAVLERLRAARRGKKGDDQSS